MDSGTVASHLVLLDIDGTMLVTGGVGVRAMELAGKDMFGPDFTVRGIDFAGRLDPILFNEMFAQRGVDPTPEAHRRFRAAYGARLRTLIAETPTARALPGVHALIAAIRSDQRFVNGVLTGNFAETGSLKLKHCDIDPTCFTIAVWGDASPHDPPLRDHLPPVAIKRFREMHGRDVDPRRVVVIGDTPHDVRCAAVNGCRSIGVATGKFSVDELRAAGADGVFADLSDTSAVVGMIGAM